MTVPIGRAPRSSPNTEAGTRAFIVTPFQRLARSHAGSAMADAMVAAALADSLFFALPADAARSPVVRYLLITMLPYAVLSPLVGPLIDRLKGGHRFVLVATLVARAGLSYLMIDQIGAGGTTFFLLALCVLVAQRAGQVARSALVPAVVNDDDELVEANSKLAIISGVAGFVGIVPAAMLLRFAGAGWALGLAMITFSVAAVLALRIPRFRVAVERPDETERHELRGPGIVLAGSAMGLLRMCVGFLTLLIAFDFRGGDKAPWEFGLVAGASVLSQLTGAAIAPRLKRLTSEENILTGALVLVVFGGFLSLAMAEVPGAVVLGACVGMAAGLGKLAFDSILQRDAPDANRGRAFARFETRFQITYVVGAFIPVAFTISAKGGFLVVTVVALFAVASYMVGRLAYAHRTGSRRNAATAAAVEIEQRFAEVSGEVKGRLSAAPRTFLDRLRGGPLPDGTGSDETRVPTVGPGVGVGVGVEPPPPPPGAPWDAPTQPAAPYPPPSGPVAGGEHDETVVVTSGHLDEYDDEDLAPDSPIAWGGPTPEFPWEAPADPPPKPGEFMEDVDPTVANPFPWSPVEDLPKEPPGDQF